MEEVNVAIKRNVWDLCGDETFCLDCINIQILKVKLY